MIAVTVLYPQTATSHFDIDYYHANHMKMVHELWDSMGLRGTRVLHGKPGPDNAPPAFAVMTILDFESLDDFGKAVSAHGGPIMGDIPNFTNVQPSLQINDIAA
ncbi:MAG: EthD family reductase [Acidiphilium sp.]|nr:EthD family reductase [Acidiphilium sp.]MDD4936419.1 EthD family reductase [Acidiphilium sp.]